ncbi:DNA-directed RNA polymerase [Candidatus Micrarchaeota archaeon]|nr:DNA-directed RNA polymerase [Candidatus Micrarchaeota archaeon]
MYYVRTIEDKVRLPPNLFKSNLREAITRLLRENYERRIFKELGFVIAVYDADVESEGLVIPGDASAYYKVRFEALTFLPHVNEVYNAEIKDLVDFGAFASIGPIQGLVHISQFGPDKFSHNKKLKKITSRSGKKSIKKGDKCVVKVSTVSLKSNINDTKIGLTMRSDGLGKDEWIEESKKKSPPPKKTEKTEDKK